MTNEVADVVNTFRIIAELPADSMGAYVISMARSASDVLAVVLLQRECGVTVSNPGECLLFRHVRCAGPRHRAAHILTVTHACGTSLRRCL